MWNIDQHIRGSDQTKAYFLLRSRRGRDSSCINTTEGVRSNHGKVYSIQHYVIKFVSHLRYVGDFLMDTPVSSTSKTDCHDQIEMLLKMALNTNTNSIISYFVVKTRTISSIILVWESDFHHGVSIMEYLNSNHNI